MSEITAIVLCGGKGTRLRPFTDSVPKPLVPLADKPLLGHLLTHLSGEGVSRFVLCTGYRAAMIEEYARRTAPPHWTVTCVDSGDATMTDRIDDARKHCGDRVLICYGDTLANVALARLMRHHEQNRALATLTVFPFHSQFGIVDIGADDRVRGFSEKPILPHWINIGFLLCDPGALDLISRGEDMPAFLSKLGATGSLFAYKHSGKHLTINTDKERAEAERDIAAFYTHTEDRAA